jgi:hypothetical protein
MVRIGASDYGCFVLWQSCHTTVGERHRTWVVARFWFGGDHYRAFDTILTVQTGYLAAVGAGKSRQEGFYGRVALSYQPPVSDGLRRPAVFVLRRLGERSEYRQAGRSQSGPLVAGTKPLSQNRSYIPMAWIVN